jgi:hypothetical protein
MKSWPDLTLTLTPTCFTVWVYPLVGPTVAQSLSKTFSSFAELDDWLADYHGNPEKVLLQLGWRQELSRGQEPQQKTKPQRKIELSLSDLGLE